MDERLSMLRRFGIHNFPADTTPGECSAMFNKWVLLHQESFPKLTPAALGRLLPQLGFRPIGRTSNGRKRLYNPHYKAMPI
jgi:hypothetical protein